MAEIRAFVAIELPEEVKNELGNQISKLRSGREDSVKWVKPEGIHLTLKFLGNVSEQRILDVKNALSKSVVGKYPFELNLCEAGAFPNLKSPRVAWVGIAGDLQEITNLHTRIETALVTLGFPKERRGFSAHLTLGRVKDKATKQERVELGSALGLVEMEHHMPFTVSGISLMQSVLMQSGAIYEQIAHFALDKN